MSPDAMNRPFLRKSAERSQDECIVPCS